MPDIVTGDFTYSEGNKDLITYSGADIQLLFSFTDPILSNNNVNVAATVALLSTLSISTHREKHPVRALGLTNPNGFTYGPRTIAGSMVLINPANTGLIEHLVQGDREGVPDEVIQYARETKLDELAPFLVVGQVTNPATGRVLTFKLEDVTFVDNGTTLGIDEGFTETVVQYYARDMSDINRLQS